MRTMTVRATVKGVPFEDRWRIVHDFEKDFYKELWLEMLKDTQGFPDPGSVQVVVSGPVADDDDADFMNPNWTTAGMDGVQEGLNRRDG